MPVTLEMTEWALPGEATSLQAPAEIARIVDRLAADQAVLIARASGGIFSSKSTESNEMYCRMLDVSRRVEAAESHPAVRELAGHLLREARTLLYQVQCNCSYWHGAFGGLYLPHLRNAVYSRLIQADTLLEQFHGRTANWVQLDADDYNGDARKELRIATDRMIGWLVPSKGADLYEWDIRTIGVNLLATLNRRFEPYHDRIRDAARSGNVSEHGGGVFDRNGAVRFKQPGLDQKLGYDHWPRKK